MRRMLMRKPFNRMEGLTLLETMFALAVGALVLIGATIFYLSTKQTGNANKAVSDMNSIMAAYASYGTGNRSISGVSVTDLQDAGFLPTTLVNPWGTTYTAVTSVTATASSVKITINGIGPSTTDKNCAAIAALVGTSATVDTTACAFTYVL